MEDIFQAMHASDQWHEIVLRHWEVKYRAPGKDITEKEEGENRDQDEYDSRSLREDNVASYDGTPFIMPMLC